MSADQHTLDGYFESRLHSDPRRGVLWRTLCQHVFQAYVPRDGTVVELGAARGDFINRIQARRRVAVDIWPGLAKHVDADVEVQISQAHDLDFLENQSVDVVFASNLLEHLQLGNVRDLVKEIRRILKPGGQLILMQPNYRISVRRYFDDYTHVSIWSDVSLSDFLEAEGLEIELVKPRFLPLTIRSRAPIHPLLIRLYLLLPFKPFAGQMLVVARNKTD